MMRMNIGYVYKIYENTNRAVFYGSTKQALSKRIYVHKSQYKLWCNKLTPTPTATPTATTTPTPTPKQTVSKNLQTNKKYSLRIFTNHLIQ